MIESCVICKKNISTDDNKYDIETKTLEKQNVTIQNFLLDTVFELANSHEHFFDDTNCCKCCYDLLLELEESITKCKTIQHLIINTYLEATEITSKYECLTAATSEDINFSKTTANSTNIIDTPISPGTKQSDSIINIIPNIEENETNKIISSTKQETIEFGLLPTSMKGPFCCELCGKTYQGRQAFKLHLRTHTTQNLFECKDCSRKFTQKKDLERHQVIHTGVKPYKCKICDKAFSFEGSIQAHYKVHAGKREFSCEMCDKTFVFKQHLTRHMKTHNGKKTAECKLCNAKFFENYNLVAHMKKHKK